MLLYIWSIFNTVAKSCPFQWTPRDFISEQFCNAVNGKRQIIFWSHLNCTANLLLRPMLNDHFRSPPDALRLPGWAIIGLILCCTTLALDFENAYLERPHTQSSCKWRLNNSLLWNRLNLCLLSCSSQYAHACNTFYLLEYLSPRSEGTKETVPWLQPR